MTLPTHARTVIVGGGIAGCSVAYHLAVLGHTDVLLLEQGQLTGGTTWHAAGLVGQIRANRAMTAMSREGIHLYSTLEQDTGLATGWKACGSLTVARTRDRLRLLRKQAAMARGFGVEVHEISPAEAGERFPLMRTDDLAGALWIPGDGKANPTDLTQSLARGARQRGVRIAEGVQVLGVQRDDSGRLPRITGLEVLHQGERQQIACETLVNCAGQWARQFGALAGVNVPLYPAEHFYLVTDRIPGVHPMLPVLRDPDGLIYYKEEVGGLVMGGFELEAKPWAIDTIPADFQFQLLPEDWDQFQPLMESALHRTPCLETAPIKMLLNGPESFTPDGQFILGEAPGLGGYFVCAGFNSAGIANAGGAGRRVAEWIVNGAPTHDLWDVDIRRFGPHNANRRALAARTAETLGLHYAMRWPRQELQSARPLRTSPLHDRLAARGAVFGSKNGWERANWFAPAGPTRANITPAAIAPPTLDRPGWLAAVIDEQHATREAVALYDQSSFGKLLLQGRDALALLQRLCANDVDVPVGRQAYTGLLNERGGYESDVTVLRLAPTQFLIVTGSAQPTRDADWITRQMAAWLPPGAEAMLTDVSGQWSVLSLMGPNARPLLAQLGAGDLLPSALPWGASREIDVGWARVRAVRQSYVGGPGYELIVPVEMARHVDEVLHDAGEAFGLKDAGYFALDALRTEAGRRAWGAEIGTDETPLDAGLDAYVAWQKPDFIGRAALLAAREAPRRKRLVKLALDRPADWLWGGEPVSVAGEGGLVQVGEVSSAGWGWRAGACVGLAWVRGPLVSGPIDALPAVVDLFGEPVPARLWAA